MYVAGREGVRTQLEVIFIILTKKGGDRFRRGYRYHRGMSSSRGLVKLRENATANQELALAA